MKIRTRYWIELIIIVICIFLAYFYLIYSSDIVKTLRYRCSDFLFSISNYLGHPTEYRDKLTIIAIDEESLADLKIDFPIKRSFITKVVKKLRKNEPRLIFLNFLLAGETTKEKTSDLVFAAAIEKAKNIVLPIYYDLAGNRVGPLNIFEKEAYKVGFINKIRDWDSGIRRCMLFHLSEGGILDEYALELKIASEYKGIKEHDFVFKKPLPDLCSGYEEIFREKNYKIPIQKDGSMYINYQVRPEQLRAVHLSDFIRKKVKSDYLKDKIVIVADVTETGSAMQNTPLGLMPGVYVFTNELIMLLSERYIQPLGLIWQMPLALLLMIITGFFTLRYNIGRSLVIVLSIGIVIFILSFLGFQNGFLVDYFSLIFPMSGIFIFIGFFRFLVLLEGKIDELKEANIKIQEAQEELIKKEQFSVIGKMSAKILHEIKGPLANIKTCIDVIKSSIREDPKSKRIVQLAGDEINRMFELSQQLRDTYTPHLEDLKIVDINNLLQDAVEISQKRFYDKGAGIAISLASGIPVAKVSPSKIKQVFINILNNAFEAVSAGGKVKISSSIVKLDDKDYISIIFNNDGPQIPKEDIPRIFDAFFSTKKESGSGLGLFICREIIKAHKGDITAKSNKEEGTTFTILLPII